MTNTSTLTPPVDNTDRTRVYHSEFHFPKFDSELQLSRVKYHLMEE